MSDVHQKRFQEQKFPLKYSIHTSCFQTFLAQPISKLRDIMNNISRIATSAAQPLLLVCTVVLASFLPASSASADDNYHEALSLSIQQNMGARTFENTCAYKRGFSSDSVKSTVVLIPINKEIIDSAVLYKQKSEKLTDAEYQKLLEENYSTYLRSDVSVFLLMVQANNSLDDDDEIFFSDFKKSMFLRSEYQKKDVLRYTHIFDEKLSPGWNKGFIYFQDFRKASNFSYSVHFSNFTVSACKEGSDGLYTHKAGRYAWAFSFDESDIGFFAMLEKGISSETIRTKYGITASTSSSFTGSDLLNVIGLVLNVVSIIR